MKVTYVDTAHSATVNPTAIDAQAGTDDDRVIKKIIIGNPVSGATLILYTNANSYYGATTNIALKVTLPTFSTTNLLITPFIVDLMSAAGAETTASPNGLILQGGGSISTSSAMQVSILWDLPEA